MQITGILRSRQSLRSKLILSTVPFFLIGEFIVVLVMYIRFNSVYSSIKVLTCKRDFILDFIENLMTPTKQVNLIMSVQSLATSF